MSFVSTYSALSVRGWQQGDPVNVVYFDNLLRPTLTDYVNGGNTFGYNSDISNNGNAIVVGMGSSYYSTLAGVLDGAAYVFQNTPSGQILDTILTSNANVVVGFGTSVSINDAGNIVAVGAPIADIGNTVNQGEVFIFAKTGNTWEEKAIIPSPYANSNIYFGSSVSLSNDGTVLLVRHPSSTTANQGVSIYYQTGNTANWTLSATTVKTTGSFGISSALAKDATSANLSNVYYIVGAYTANSNRGGSYIFQSSTEIANLAGNVSLSALGTSVAITNNANAVVIGAPGLGPANIVGSARVYANIGGAWTFQQTITQPNALPLTDFGNSVAINSLSNKILIAEPIANVTEFIPNSGPFTYANVGVGYEYSGSNLSFSLANTYHVVLDNTTYDANIYFSYNGVAIDGNGNNLLFNATNDYYSNTPSGTTDRSGSVYIFKI